MYRFCPFPAKLGRRRLACVVLAYAALVAAALWRWELPRASLAPPPPDQDLNHLRSNRSLEHYLDNIQLLIEPSSTLCSGLEHVPMIVLVTTSPSRYDHRAVIRDTWAKFQPTYFVLGINGDNVDERLVDTYLEAKQYGDMVVWEFRDHYQNLTLKTALMLQWTLDRCPQARFLYKVDDDVLLNPWRLGEVMKEKGDVELLGFRILDSKVHRDEYTKWYMPRWLFPRDTIPEYLSGPGYIINANYLDKILKTAKTVPLINLEDVYFTYLVSKEGLGLRLTHDPRLNVFRPWMPWACGYWSLASAHSFTPGQMESMWKKIEYLSTKKDGCSVYNYFFGY